jgi:hypothetical protein
MNVIMLNFLWMSVILPNGIGNHSSQVIHEILLLHRSNSSRKKETVASFFLDWKQFIGTDLIVYGVINELHAKQGLKQVLSSSRR